MVRPFAPAIDAEATLVEPPRIYASDIRLLPDATYLVQCALRCPVSRLIWCAGGSATSCRPPNTINSGTRTTMCGWTGKIKHPVRLSVPAI